MRSTYLFALLLLLFFVTSTTANGQAPPEYVMKVTVGNPEAQWHFGWTPFVIFKHEVENRSKGRIQVDLFAEKFGNSSLEMIDMIRNNIVQGRDFADGHFATIYPPIQVLSIPYLFAEREIAWKVLDGPFGDKLIADMAKKTGLRPLFWLENGGFRHFSNNKRAVHSPEDMKGLRFRTMESPLHLQIVKNLGAQGIPIGWSHVYDAIAEGIVDGQENSLGTFMIPHLEKIQKYIVLDGHIYATYTFLINEQWYQSLPPDLQLILRQTRPIVSAANRGLSVVSEYNAFEYLRSQGIDIYKPTTQEYMQFRQQTRQSATSWLNENIGSHWVKEVLEATEEAEKELGFQE